MAYIASNLSNGGLTEILAHTNLFYF